MAKRRFSQGAGPSQRQLRVGELIRRKLSDVLMHGDIHDPDLNRMSITVSEVRVTADLHIATVFVMPLGGKHLEEAIASLAKHKGELRHLVGKATGLKHTPDLRFLADPTFDQMDETRRLFSDERVRRDVESGSEDE
ncbi:MAG TPA: 30S ribosome-binding factor RbfA [Rhodobacterales bacterium]|nr:30S ribosome-binding factor RbfA [Rhodobacterales bacterium]